MKLKGFAITLAVGAVVFTGCENAGSDASSGEVVLNTKKDTVAYFMGMMTGKQLKDAFNFEDLDEAIVAAGTKAGFEGDSTALFTQEEVGPVVQAYFQEMQAEKTKAQFGDQEAEGEKFLTEMETKEGVTSTGTGLLYEVVLEGAGANPVATDQVTVHYTGKLLDGTVFDSSVDRGEPSTFGLNQVIPGWTEGLQLMTPGSKYTFYIPHYLAYGEQGAGQSIPPFSTLIFEVELISIAQ
ncbi:MAG: FKBP-type peptidyl-prolyl cis-trans isomerase [Salibacteraceae bacterium]|jgi:FKBP-type peptidyl-prolyl cis-trans isomerase